MDHLEELIEAARQADCPSIAIAHPHGKELLKAVKMALDLGLAAFHFFGSVSDMRRAAMACCLDVHDPSLQLHDAESDPAEAAVAYVKAGKADILMKGNVSTKELLRAVLNKDDGLRNDSLLSHVAVFDVPERNKPVILTDAAVNIAPDFRQKAVIVANAVKVAHMLGTACPKVAAIAPVDVINEAIPSTLDAARLVEYQEAGRIAGCVVGGPISFDNAISAETAAQKGVASKVAGCSDILLVPSIEAGNALYKAFVFFAKAKVAAIVCGAAAPIVLPSRADSAESKLYSMALAIAIISGKKQRERETFAANEENTRHQPEE